MYAFGDTNMKNSMHMYANDAKGLIHKARLNQKVILRRIFFLRIN